MIPDNNCRQCANTVWSQCQKFIYASTEIRVELLKIGLLRTINIYFLVIWDIPKKCYLNVPISSYLSWKFPIHRNSQKTSWSCVSFKVGKRGKNAVTDFHLIKKHLWAWPKRMKQFELNVIFPLFYNHYLVCIGHKRKMGPGYLHLVFYYDKF